MAQLDKVALRRQIRIEQLKYAPDLPIEADESECEIVYTNEHVPSEHVFNLHHPRRKGDKCAHIFLFAKPFIVKWRGNVYKSHHFNGEYIVNEHPLAMEEKSWWYVQQLTNIALSKVKTNQRQLVGWRWHEVERDLWCEGTRIFVEADTNKTANSLFSFVITSFVNEWKNLAFKEAPHHWCSALDDYSDDSRWLDENW